MPQIQSRFFAHEESDLWIVLWIKASAVRETVFPALHSGNLKEECA